MNWKVKAGVQNAVAALPPIVADPIYYWMQRRFGRMRAINPIGRLTSATEAYDLLERTGASPVGTRFLEIGTGWRLNLPIGLWLQGARSVVTIDLRRYLKAELVQQDVEYIRAHRAEVEMLFGRRLDRDRMQRLLDFPAHPWDIEQFLRYCDFQYVAPGDAARLPLPNDSLDVEVSFYVLEHILPRALRAIHAEAFRVLRPGGKVVHRIDLSDHYSHSDPSISPIHFLRFGERSWKLLSGNRYMYANRLRVDDHVRFFEEAGLRVTLCDRFSPPRALEQLRDPGFRVDASFRDKSESDLVTTTVLIVAEKPARA
ncbi:MAG: methyltransferase domain-containing protein [Candidatus Latescibacteria bacterium]|nr:methyltransferase domain-containing protein [Candidatus Latescibacterota bacterium]